VRERKRERKREKEKRERIPRKSCKRFFPPKRLDQRSICVYVRLYDDSASTRIRKSEKRFEIKKNKRKRKKEKMIKPKK